MSTLNSLVPMEDPDGNRCFVNNWDVKPRQDEGWKILGKLEHHNASKDAPVALLIDPKAPTKAAAPDAALVERARVKAILKAADDSQSELADKLIADGKPEAVALKALADDKAAKVKAKGKQPAPPDAPPAS